MNVLFFCSPSSTVEMITWTRYEQKKEILIFSQCITLHHSNYLKDYQASSRSYILKSSSSCWGECHKNVPRGILNKWTRMCDTAQAIVRLLPLKFSQFKYFWKYGMRVDFFYFHKKSNLLRKICLDFYSNSTHLWQR